MVQIPPWFHSTFKEFSKDSHTPKSELKRRSYGPNKLDKKNWLLSRKNVATKQNNVATKPKTKSEC